LGLGVTGVIAILLIAAAAYGAYAFFLRPRPAAFQNFSVNKITETGKARYVALSPEGKYILTVVDDKGQQSLWLRNVPTDSNTQVMPPEPVDYLGVRFSSDGNYLYFVRGEPGEALRYLYRAPVLGGNPQKLITDIDTNITFSPDGHSLAYAVMNNPELGKLRLVTYSLDSGESKTLVAGSMTQRISDPAWSPDGKTIVCVILQPGEAITGLMAVDAITGKQSLIFDSNDGILSNPAWLPDGSGLMALFKSRDSNFSRRQIVEVSPRDRKFRAVSHDLNDYSDLSLSGDGHLLAAVLRESHYDIYVAPAAAVGSPVQPLPTGPRTSSFSWTPDGQLVLDQDTLNLFHLTPETRPRSTRPNRTAQPSSLPSAPMAAISRQQSAGTLEQQR
jgi:Tol biopolymer transport system component